MEINKLNSLVYHKLNSLVYHKFNSLVYQSPYLLCGNNKYREIHVSSPFARFSSLLHLSTPPLRNFIITHVIMVYSHACSANWIALKQITTWSLKYISTKAILKMCKGYVFCAFPVYGYSYIHKLKLISKILKGLCTWWSNLRFFLPVCIIAPYAIAAT